MTRWLALVFIVLFIAGSISSQATPADTDKPADDTQERLASLADRIQADAAALVLAENRSLVDARTGVILCKSDKKLSASLFQSSISELTSSQSSAEAEAKSHPSRSGSEIKIPLTIRPVVLTVIAGCDAVFALESLYRSRTPSIQQALSASPPADGKVRSSVVLNAAFVRSELALEQRLALLAAMQNPDLAIKMLQDSIRKGLSVETLGLLKKLYDKDPESANSLAAEVLDRLSASTFSNDPAEGDNVTLATNILSDYLRAKKPDAKELKFDDVAIRSLAQKLISFTLIPSGGLSIQRFSAVIAIAEKLSPGSVAALKKMQKNSVPKSLSGFLDADARRMLTGKATPDQMISDAKQLAPDSRPLVYQAAANKMAQAGDLNRANDLLNANFSGAALDAAVNQVNAAYATYLIGQGRFADAERFIDDFPEETRFNSLLNLATAAFKKDNVENKAFATAVLRKARTALPDHPIDAVDLSKFMQIAAAYSPIEPDEAFATVEPLIRQLNELADATAVVQGFQNNFNVRSGEFELGVTNSYGFRLDPAVFRVLAKADFERTSKLIDTFSRRELRIAVRLQLAESGLK